MASTVIGALRVIFSADSAAFESGAKRVRNQASMTAKSMGTAKAAVTGFFSAFSIGVLATIATRSLQMAAAIGEVSQQLGVTTRDLQVFRYAAGQVGVTNEQLETGLSKLTVTMGKVAAGAKAPTKAFEAIGISVDELKGKDTGEVLRMVADGLAKIPDRAQRAAVEVALFGKSGAQLDNLLAGGRRAIDQLAEAADRLGIVLSEKEIQNADETADKLEAVKTVLQAQIAGVVAQNANSILGLAQALGTLTGEILRFLNSNPQLALGIIGALLGGRVGGLPGAAVGAVGGVMLGNKMAKNAADQNMDPRFRQGQLNKALKNYRAAKSGAGSKVAGPDGIPIRTPAGEVLEGARAELQRQIDLGRQATALANKPKQKAITPGVNIPQFLAGGGGGGGSKKKDTSDRDAERKRMQELRDAYQFSTDMRRNQMDILQAQRDLTHTVDGRAKLDLQMLDLEREGYKAQLDYDVATTDGNKAEAEARAASLLAEYDKADALKRQAIQEEALLQKREDAARLMDTQYDIMLEAAQLEAGLAETADERRKAEIRILDIARQREEAALKELAASKDAAVAADARARLAALPAKYEGQKANIMQGTRGPREQYLAELPRSLGMVNERLQEIEARTLNSLKDDLATATAEALGLKGALGELASSLIRLGLDVLEANIRGLFGADAGQAQGSAQLVSAGATLTTAATTLTGAGGMLNSSAVMWTATAAQIMAAATMLMAANAASGVTSAVSGVAGGFQSFGVGPAAILGFAHGGEGTFLGNFGTDRNLLSMNGIPIARVSRGERFQVSNNDNSSRRGGDTSINVPVTVLGGGKDAHRTGFQAGQAAARQIARTTRRSG